MIKNYYKDINLMADVYEFIDGRRYALPWSLGSRLVQQGKLPDLGGSRNGMETIASKYWGVILEYGNQL